MPSSLRTTPQAIAAVGLTVDGREITEQDIDDIVESYDPAIYGARINLDHYGNWGGWAAELNGIELNGCMLGDVISVTKGNADDGTPVLLAVLCPNESLLKLNQADQAVYYSIEIVRNFMDTGKTYLTGLAMTDYPASTRTTRAHFSKDGNQTTAPGRFALALDPSLGQSKGLFKNLFNNIFTPSEKDEEMKPEQLSSAIKEALGEPLAQFSSALQANTDAISQLKQNFGDQNGDKPKATAENAGGQAEFGDQNGDKPKGPAAQASFGDQNGDKPKVKENAEDDKFSALNDKFSALETKVDKFVDAFGKALSAPAASTTPSDEEHEDQDNKYGTWF